VRVAPEALHVFDAVTLLERGLIDEAAAGFERFVELGEHERVETEIALERGVRRDLARGSPRNCGDRDAHRAEVCRCVVGRGRREDEALEDPLDLFAFDLTRRRARERRVVEVNDARLHGIGQRRDLRAQRRERALAVVAAHLRQERITLR
jgi:hypothetical protein